MLRPDIVPRTVLQGRWSGTVEHDEAAAGPELRLRSEMWRRQLRLRGAKSVLHSTLR
jgi:hypothetical protein